MGYALMQRVAAARRGTELGAATMYRSLRRMLADGLVAQAEQPTGVDERRRPYRLTDDGLRALAAEGRRMAALVGEAVARGVPERFHSITPQLVVSDPDDAIAATRSAPGGSPPPRGLLRSRIGSTAALPRSFAEPGVTRIGFPLQMVGSGFVRGHVPRRGLKVATTMRWCILSMSMSWPQSSSGYVSNVARGRPDLPLGGRLWRLRSVPPMPVRLLRGSVRIG
jgi:hypothetical protein